MWYNWKDVRNNMVFSLVFGVVLAVMAFFIGKYIARGDYTNQVEIVSWVRFNVMAWASMWTLMLNAFYFWSTGVSIWHHGWRLKVMDGLGNNIVFLVPFALAFWLA